MSCNEVNGWFKKKRFLTSDELIEILSELFLDAKAGTLSARLHRMKKEALMRNVRRDLYATGSRPQYEPVISGELSGLFKKQRT